MERSPIVAGMFYPADAATCRHDIETYLGAVMSEAPGGNVAGGVVPHAGWIFSAATAAHVYAALAQGQPPETVVLFGAVHSWGVTGPSVYGEGHWRTPLGSVAIDEELAGRLLSDHAGLLTDRPAAHAEEHSIEVQIPFVQYLFPEARILPISVPPGGKAPDAGRAVAETAQRLGRRAVAVGSSDLTHYGPRYGMAPAGAGESALKWIRENDARLLDCVEEMDAAGVLAEAASHYNACGAGAIAAAIGFCAALGATEGTLLHYTTSHDVLPQGIASDMVGYGAVVFS